MAYEMTLVLVLPDENRPLERAGVLIQPFLHGPGCLECGPKRCAKHGLEHLWHRAVIGGDWYENGWLWRDRYGRLPKDHPINCLSDEIRKASDVDLRATFLEPAALIFPDGKILDEQATAHPCWLARYANYEDRLWEYPQCWVVPFSCRNDWA